MREIVEQTILGLAAIFSIVVSVLDWLKLLPLPPGTVASLTLLGVGLITGYLVLERRGKLDNIENLVKYGTERILQSLDQLPAAEVTRFSDSQSAIAYLSEKVKTAKTSVDQASIDERRSTFQNAHNQFHTVKTSAIKASKIEYRYLFMANQRRVNNVKEWLQYSKGKFIAAGLKTLEKPIGFFSFTIFDRKEVWVRNPYYIGQSAVYLTIRQPDIVALFLDWYDYLWSQANRIDPNLPPQQQHTILNDLIS